MEVRKARASDVDKLAELGLKLVKSHYKFDRKMYEMKKKSKSLFLPYFKKHVRSNDSLFQVAEENGKIMGYCLCFVEQWPPIYKRSKNCRLQDIYVLPGHRKKGLAGNMIENAIAFAKKKKCDSIAVKVNEQNKTAIRRYKKSGFKPNTKDMLMKT